MGAANFPGGYGRGGLDPVPETQAATAKRAPRALFVDGATRDHALDADGRYLSVHPVDATVFQILRTVAGSISSAPGAGQTVGQLEIIDRAKIQAQVEDRVTVALEPLVTRGSVRVLNIIVEPRQFGGVVFSVDYLNLELAQEEQRQQFQSAP